MALLLANANGDLLVPPPYYKILLGNFICPTNFGPKHPNSDKVTSRNLEKASKIWTLSGGLKLPKKIPGPIITRKGALGQRSHPHDI